MKNAKTKLDELLEKIDPDNTIDKYSAEIDELFNSFPMNFSKIEGWDDFRLITARFYAHMCYAPAQTIRSEPFRNYLYDQVVKRSDGFFYDPQIEFYYSGVSEVLLQEYHPEGPNTAKDLARTGTEGGIYSVLKKIALHIQNSRTNGEIYAEVSKFIRALSFDELRSAQSEYISKYGHLLPREVTENDHYMIVCHFDKVLEEHPHLIKRVRDIK